MANNDGLSQNVEIHVGINEQSLRETQGILGSLSAAANIEIGVGQEAKDFMKELRKELGLGKKAKIRVGGYSTGGSQAPTVASSDPIYSDDEDYNKTRKVTRKRSSSWKTSSDDLFESVNFDIMSMADSAEAAIAKEANQAAQELSKRLGLKFVDSYAESVGQEDFTLPIFDSRELKGVGRAGEKYQQMLQQATDDFILDAAGNVTISPAMLLAAAERVYKNNPGIVVPDSKRTDLSKLTSEKLRLESKLVGVSESSKYGIKLQNELKVVSDKLDKLIAKNGISEIKPLPAGKDALEKASADQVKNFNAEVEKRIDKGDGDVIVTAFYEKTVEIFDGIIDRLLKNVRKDLMGFGNIQKLIKTDGTWDPSSLSSEDAMAGTLRYAVEPAQAMLPNLEEEAGLQRGTLLAHGGKFVSKKYGVPFDQLPDTGMDIAPPGFVWKILSQELGPISEELTDRLPDAIQEYVASPFEQILSNPIIFGKGMATQPSRQLTRVSNIIKENGTTVQTLGAEKGSGGFVGGGSTFKDGPEHQLDVALDLLAINEQNLKLSTSPADKEARQKRIADLTEEIKLLETKLGITAEEFKVQYPAKVAAEAEKAKLAADKKSAARAAARAKEQEALGGGIEASNAAAQQEELARIDQVAAEEAKAAEAKLKAEQKAEEQKIANQKAAEKRAADQAAKEAKALEAKMQAEQKAAEAKIAAEKKAAESKPEKRVGIIPMPIPESKQPPVAQLDSAAKAAAAVMPQLDKYRPVIGDAIVDSIVKLIGEAGGDVSKITAAFDTEFIENNKKPIYEAGVTLKNAIGEFVDIFKMVQIPVGKQSEIDYRLKAQGAGAKDVSDIRGRAFKLGISRHDVGTGAGDEADMKQYRDKLVQLGTVIQALDEVGIKLAGNNIVDADFRLLAQSFQSVNDALAGIEGIDQIKVPSPTNVADLLKIVEILKKTPGLERELATLVQGKIVDGKEKGDTTLGSLLKKVLDMRPGMGEAYGVKSTDSGFAFGDTPAHYAVADNRASLIVLEFLKEFAQSANLIAQGTGILGDNYVGGTAGPYGNDARAKYPSAFGGGFAVDPAERAAAADEHMRETAAQEANNKAVKTGADLARKRLNDDKEYQKLLEKLTDARKAYQIVNGAVASNGVIQPADKTVLEGYLVKLDELAKTSKDAAAAAASIRAAMDAPSKQAAFVARRDVKAVGEELSLKKSEMAYKSEAAVKEVADKRKAQSSRMYENTATQVERNITMAASERGRVLKQLEQHEPGGYDTAKIDKEAERTRESTTTAIVANTKTRVLSIEQEEKARKDASETIKRIYKDQVQAEKDVQAATKASVNQWVTGRYALYDVGNAYQNVSTQLFRVARRIFDITKSYRDYETAFTSVERAMQLDFDDPAGGAKELKDQFIALSEVIPVAFEELSRIATLGAQMGISAQGIVKFTETVAQFSAVTGIAADTVAQKFGKIAELTNLPTDQFDKLGSAVTFAGVNAVATESEILTLSESIAAVSSQVGMTTPDVVGLGTALSSVGIPAEQARGVFTRVFADIDRAVATGGKSLDAFASTAGMSSKDFAAAWGQQGESYGVFRAMLGGINSAADLTKAFDKLGITETREINTLTRLANNLNVVDGAMTDAAASFGDGEFLLDSFEKTTNNLDSQITIFQNNLKSLGESLGQYFGGTLKGALEVGSKVIEVLKGMSESPVLRFLSLFSAGTVVFVGAIAGAGAILAKVTAQIYAFRVAAINSANNIGDIDNSIKKIKQLTNLGGGLVEMRDKLLTGNSDVRGEIVPKNYSLLAFARGEKAKQAYLLKTENIFLASSREQADSLQRLILLRQHEIENIMTSSTATGVEAAAKRAALATEALYVEVIGTEATALTANEYAELKAAAAAEAAAKVKNGEATARLKNVQAITAETRAATGAGLAAGGAITTFMSFLGAAGIAATVLSTVIGIVQGITMAAEEAKKIDLAGSGLGIEALRETIKEDTQVWKDSGEAIAVQSSRFVETEATAKKYAKAISGLSTELGKAYGSQKELVDVTKEQSVAFGQSTKQLILNAILANEKIQELVNNNANMFNDLAGMGFNASDMVDAIMGDPEQAKAYLDGIARGVEELDKKIRIAKWEASEYVALDNGAEIRGLEQSKKELEALGAVGAEAMAQIEKALNLSKIADVMKGYSQSFLGLEAKMKSAMKTGKGMASVMKLIKAASYDLIKNSDIKVNFDGANSVKEMLKVTEAAKQTALAFLRMKFAVSGASSTAAGAAEAALTAQYEPLERNLKALSNASNTTADDANKLGGAAESAADKLKRLLGAANSSVSAAMNLNSALRSLGTALKGSSDWSLGTEGAQEKFNAILAVITQIGENAGSNFPKAIRELQAFQIVLKDMGAPQTALNLVGNAIKAIGGDATLTAKQVNALKKAFPSLFANMEKQLTGAASKAIKTLSEYASDLKSVLAAAFEYRYSKQMGLDDIANAWQAIKDSAESAQQAMDDANKTIMGLNADKNLLDYQLKIAIKYNDLERQKFLRNKLAETNASLAEESKKVAEANALKDKSLKNDTKSSIDNRNQVRGLVQTYTNYLTTLAATGMSADGLKAEAKKLAAEFLTQGVNLGFAKSELEDYTKAFEGDFTTVLGGLPSEITLSVNTDPALRAIEEFVKKANAELSNVAIVGNTNSTTTTLDKPTKEQIQVYQGNKETVSTPYMTSMAKNDAKESIKFFERVYGNGYSTGGLVTGRGSGTSDSIPARLSNGEFVVNAAAVRAYGVDFMNSLNQQRASFSPVQPQAQAQQSQGSQMVYLSPEDRQLLRAAIDRPVALYTENTKIAQSANAGNLLLAQRGSN